MLVIAFRRARMAMEPANRALVPPEAALTVAFTRAGYRVAVQRFVGHCVSVLQVRRVLVLSLDNPA